MIILGNMFIDFNKVYFPTEEEKRKQDDCIQLLIKEKNDYLLSQGLTIEEIELLERLESEEVRTLHSIQCYSSRYDLLKSGIITIDKVKNELELYKDYVRLKDFETMEIKEKVEILKEFIISQDYNNVNKVLGGYLIKMVEKFHRVSLKSYAHLLKARKHNIKGNIETVDNLIYSALLELQKMYDVDNPIIEDDDILQGFREWYLNKG